MKRKKKPLRWGCEGWRPIVGVMPKTNGKQAPPLSFAVTPTVARDARPSPPSPYRKKSRSAKKKSAPPKKTRLPQTVGHRMGGMPLSPPPTQCYPLYCFYSPPHPTIRQRIKCRGAIFCARPSLPTHPVIFHNLSSSIS